MIDEKILLEYMQRMKYRIIADGDDRAKGYNNALEMLRNFMDKMPKVDPIIVKPDDEGLRNKLHDIEFERDFYKLHFEELLQRKVEG